MHLQATRSQWPVTLPMITQRTFRHALISSHNDSLDAMTVLVSIFQALARAALPSPAVEMNADSTARQILTKGHVSGSELPSSFGFGSHALNWNKVAVDGKSIVFLHRELACCISWAIRVDLS